MSTVMLTRNTACLIERMTEHAKADEIIKGVGWDRGKGCFVGCCLHEYDHSKFPEGLGWPVELGYLCDGIFEGLSNADAKQFALDVPNAVGVDGKDLSMVLPHFLFWLLADPNEGVIRFVPADKFPQQHKAISDVAELRRRQIAGEIDGPSSAARDAALAALAALAAALAAARDAAWAARDAAWAAALAAARDAALAALAAAWAARDAAWAAARDAARDAAWDAARKQQAAKLIELLKAAPVVEVQGKDEY